MFLHFLYAAEDSYIQTQTKWIQNKHVFYKMASSELKFLIQDSTKEILHGFDNET